MSVPKRYSDAALLKGEYAHMAAEFRAGERFIPKDSDWREAACSNSAEAAAQEVARHIFEFQQSVDNATEQMEVLTWSAAGQMKVLVIHPGQGDLLRLDGILIPEGQPSSLVINCAQLSLTFVRVPIETASEDDDGLNIGFVIFDELKERQKARTQPAAKASASPKSARKKK
ncbi:MAG: hypothetical protein WBO55_01605 [Rhizobiaceae bacterium]